MHAVIASRSTSVSALGLLCMVLTIADGRAAACEDAPAWAETFASKLEAAMERRDVEAVREAFDVDALVARIFDGLPIPMADRMGYRAGMRLSFDWGAVAQALGDHGHYRLMRVGEHDGGADEDHEYARAVFRIVNAGGGFDYHDLLLRATTDREGGLNVHIVDALTLSTAEWASDTPRLKWRLKDAEGEDLALRNALDRIEQLTTMGRFGEALARWRTLPESAKRKPGIAVQSVIFASHIGFDELVQQAAWYTEQFPELPAADQLLLPVWQNNEKHEHALESIARLRAWAGPDAFLDYVEGNTLYRMDRRDEAVAAFERSVEREPTLIEPRLSLLTASLDAEDHEATLELLLAIEALGVELNDPATNPAFKTFVASPMYEQWRQARERE